MRFNIRSILTAIAIGLFAVVAASQSAHAQDRRNDDRRQDQRTEKQRKKAVKAAEKAEKQRLLWERQRQAAWTRRNRQVQIVRSGNDRSGGLGYYVGNANDNTNRDGRYRIYRNGSYYNTDQRGADLLRQAVNQGYRQGFQAGRNDRNDMNRRTYSWSNSNVYRSGNMGYQSYVNRNQYRYYFQQGFQRGYQDGSNTRYDNDYDGQYEYGYYNDGSPSILESILNTVLRIQTY
ncbi:MAG TPA: hypothetical protein VFZ49_09930 [Pyrinomonadaceae bacterium]